MALPRRAGIHELGPRAGIEIEKTRIRTENRIRLVDILSGCVISEIPLAADD